jgi:hypothetical protein
MSMKTSNSFANKLHAGKMPSAPKQPSIVWLAEGFGFDATSGEWFTANATALAALEWHHAGLQRAQMIARMTEQFEVGAATAERDLEAFFAALPDAFCTSPSH